MNIIYNRLFNLEVAHDYFSDGIDRLVTLHPTIGTQDLLRNGKMLFKKVPNGLTVLYRAFDDEVTPFIELSNNQHFIFSLKAENISELLNITDLDESPSKKYSTGNLVYFTNNPAQASSNNNNPETLSLEIIDTVRSSLFTYQFKINGNPANVKMRVTKAGNPVSIGNDGAGNPLPNIVPLAINENNTYTQQIDLRKEQKGRFKITILSDDETTIFKEEEIYVDENIEREKMLGIVDLVYESATNNLYGKTEEYKLQLIRAKTYWKYYVVNKSPNIDLATDSLIITDATTPNGSPYVKNDFTRAYSGIKITAKLAGVAGNSVALEYTGSGNFPAFRFSGQTLSGGAAGVKAEGTLTLVNNDETAYTISIGGVDFTEGTAFSKDASPEATATNLIAAINGNGSVPFVAEILPYDILVNEQEALVFSSLQSIPFFQTPKLKIELRQLSSNQIIMANLPNPSRRGIQKEFANRLESEVYVFI